VIDQRGEPTDVDAMLTEHRLMLEAIDAELSDIDEVFHVTAGETMAPPAPPEAPVHPDLPVVWGAPSPPEVCHEPPPEPPVALPVALPSQPAPAAEEVAEEVAEEPTVATSQDAATISILPARRGFRSKATWLDNTGAVLIAGGLTLLGLALTGRV
jgi:hypothetical protein